MQYPASTQQPLNPVAAFFKNTNLVFAVYDIRRGQCEGEEAEKLLSFFPTTAPIHVRTSIVGLAQAVTSFAATLTQDDSRFKSMVADQNKWIMFECEPCVWILAVARRTWATGTCTDAAFKSLLTTLYDVFVLLHGRMATLLEQDPTGFAVRRVLQPLLDEVGSRLLRPEAAAAREPGGHTTLLANPLAPHQPATVPLLVTSHTAFLAVQCLVNQLLVASFYGSRLVGGVVVLWGGLPLWSTLGCEEDTAALVALATRALVPAARAAQRSRPAGAGTSMSVAGGSAAAAAAHGETAFETLLSPLQWRAGGGIHLAPPTTLAAMAAGLGAALSSAAAGGGAGAGGGGGGTSAGGAGAAAFGGAGGNLPPVAAAAATTAASSGFLGFGSLGGALALPLPLTSPGGASSSTPPLPVSSFAASGPSATSGSGPGAGAGGSLGGVGSALPPFLSSFLRPRLRPSMYSPATGGGGTALALPLDSVLPMANVWLRGSNEWAQLLPYHRGQLLVLVLLHDGPPPATEVLAALAAVLGRGAGPAAAALAAEVPSRSSAVWHEKGHRYCYTDGLYHASRYTPLKKVFTLSTASLRHLAHLRSKLDEWDAGQHRARLLRYQQQQQQQSAVVGPSSESGPAAGGSGVSGGGEGPADAQQPRSAAASLTRATAPASAADPEAPGPSSGVAPDAAATATSAASPATGASAAAAAAAVDADADSEVVVRTATDAWLVLRAARCGRRLYTVSEPGPEAALGSAVAPTDALCDRLFPGIFLAP